MLVAIYMESSAYLQDARYSAFPVYPKPKPNPKTFRVYLPEDDVKTPGENGENDTCSGRFAIVPDDVPPQSSRLHRVHLASLMEKMEEAD